jgi:hypothetical protein
MLKDKCAENARMMKKDLEEAENWLNENWNTLPIVVQHVTTRGIAETKRKIKLWEEAAEDNRKAKEFINSFSTAK